MPDILQIIIFTVIVGSPFSGCRMYEIKAMSSNMYATTAVITETATSAATETTSTLRLSSNAFSVQPATMTVPAVIGKMTEVSVAATMKQFASNSEQRKSANKLTGKFTLDCSHYLVESASKLS